MAVRASMATLITTLRGLTNASTSDTTIDGVTYWSDQHVQDVLDRHKQFFTVKLTAQPHYENGTLVYKRWAVPKSVGAYVESPVIATLTGYVISDSDYTLDSNAGLVTFNDSSTAGYTISGYSYNMPAAAGELWGTKASHRAHLVTIKSGAHQLWADQEYQHYLERAREFTSKSGIKYVKVRMTDYG